MFYAIHKDTKEHVIAPPLSTWAASKWELVSASTDGWIEWEGGDCPLPDNQPYEAKCTNGRAAKLNNPQSNRAWTKGWGDLPNCYGITAYRPCLNAEEAEVKQEWKLEEGCQAQASGGECEVIGIDDYRGMVAVRWHDGELGVVRIECVKKPLTERDLWIEEAERACEDVPDGDIDLIYGALYDAGLAKLPNEGEGNE